MREKILSPNGNLLSERYKRSVLFGFMFRLNWSDESKAYQPFQQIQTLV